MKIKILFFTSQLGDGGAESHLLRLVNNIDLSVVEPLLVLSRPGGNYEGLVRKEVSIIHLTTGTKSSSTALLKSIFPLSALLKEKRPDIIFSVMDHANIIACYALRIVKIETISILSVQNTPSKSYTSGINSSIIKHFIRKLYSKADCVIALSCGVKADLLSFYHDIEVKDNIKVINNCGMDLKDLKIKPVEFPTNDKFKVIACGRLVEQKGFVYLIDAFSKVRETNSNVILYIIGDGALRTDIENQICRLDLCEDVVLLGHKPNPMQYMRAADAFVLSSIHEGFGNVIIEAMAAGLPVIATRCPHGPEEILDYGKYGILVEPKNPKMLAEAILHLMENNLGERKKYKALSLERYKKYEAGNIAKTHIKLFKEILNAQHD